MKFRCQYEFIDVLAPPGEYDEFIVEVLEADTSAQAFDQFYAKYHRSPQEVQLVREQWDVKRLN